MNKIFNKWIDKCPTDFTVITVNGREAYLFGKNTDLVVDIKTKDESKFIFVEDSYDAI
jgi:hypothetical protein